MDAVSNPFHVPGKKIASRSFGARVSTIVKSFGSGTTGWVERLFCQTSCNQTWFSPADWRFTLHIVYYLYVERDSSVVLMKERWLLIHSKIVLFSCSVRSPSCVVTSLVFLHGLPPAVTSCPLVAADGNGSFQSMGSYGWVSVQVQWMAFKHTAEFFCIYACTF